MTEFRIVGGNVALDLVNTVAPRSVTAPAEHEYLQTPADLLAWARRVELVTPADASAVQAAWDASPASAARALHAALDVREALYAALRPTLDGPAAGTSEPGTSEAGEPGGPGVGDALDRLALRWSAAVARSALVLAPDTDAVSGVDVGAASGAGAVGPRAPVRVIVGTTPAMLIPDRLATTAVELLRTLDPRQVRECPIVDGGCGWVFLDQSRNGSRRWCTMADCGAHAKARRLTARRRARRETT